MTHPSQKLLGLTLRGKPYRVPRHIYAEICRQNSQAMIKDMEKRMEPYLVLGSKDGPPAEDQEAEKP